MAGYCLTYIYHDCFILETDKAVVLFDYWKDPLAGALDKDFPPLLAELDKGKPVYVLVSHHHKDHFSRRVFLWQQKIPGIRYIVSQDVAKAVGYMLREGGTYPGFRPDPSSVCVLRESERYEDAHIRVEAFGSTDIGNSYALEIGGRKFFHAGDLNAWLWLDESTPAEVEEARDAFTAIVGRIKEAYPEFDLVMFPVDSRMGREYWWGAKYFLETVRTSVFVPMHFELVLDESDKEQRRMDAAAFGLYARRDFGECLQLCGTRSRFWKA